MSFFYNTSLWNRGLLQQWVVNNISKFCQIAEIISFWNFHCWTILSNQCCNHTMYNCGCVSGWGLSIKLRYLVKVNSETHVLCAVVFCSSLFHNSQGGDSCPVQSLNDHCPLMWDQRDAEKMDCSRGGIFPEFLAWFSAIRLLIPLWVFCKNANYLTQFPQ